jgi:exopolyphosphatase
MTNKAEATDKDQKIVEYLEKIISIKPGSKFDREEYYKVVSKAKQDIGDLSLPDILRKDYKQYAQSPDFKLGIGSVVRSMQFLLDKAGGKENFNEVVKAFAKERDLSMMAIMTKSNPEGSFARELLVWASDERGTASVKKFETGSTEKLGLKEWDNGSLNLDGEKHCQRCWSQEKVANSRKQVAPLMRAAM